MKVTFTDNKFYLIRATGEVAEVAPLNGTHFSPEELQRIAGNRNSIKL